MTSRCVVFDIDDTLYLESEYVRSGFRAAADWVVARLGIEGFFERAWELFEQGKRGRVFDEVLAAYGRGATDEIVRDLVQVYRTHRPTIELLSDARECLQRLHTRCSMAIITDGPAESQEAKALALQLARWASPIVVTARLGGAFSKPHPRAFELVQESVGLAGSQVTYVADNPMKDFAAPKALGWHTIRVRRPGGIHYQVPSGHDVDVEIPDLSSISDGTNE